MVILPHLICTVSLKEQKRGQLGSSFCVSAFIKVYKLRFLCLAPVETRCWNLLEVERNHGFPNWEKGNPNETQRDWGIGYSSGKRTRDWFWLVVLLGFASWPWGNLSLNCAGKVSWIMRRRRREKRTSPQVLEQCVEVQFACLLGLISGKVERSWQDFKTWVRKKVVVLIREERKSLKLKCIGETVSASMSK